ncbi:MAG: hypothetical protein ACI358_04480 [Candidatus Limimorpha sp.]
MTLEQLAKQGRRKEIFTTAFTINENIRNARKEGLRNSFADCEHIKHRNELVATRNGVNYIDDSGAKSISATWFSLDSLIAPSVWITMSGNGDCEELVPVVRQMVKCIISIGDDSDAINKALGGLVRDGVMKARDMEEALSIAESKASSGYNVIFSPATKVDETEMQNLCSVFLDRCK